MGRLGRAVGTLLGIPDQRPKEEWEHVKVTRDGTRYVDVEELLKDERAQEQIKRMKLLAVEEPHPNRSEEEH